MPTPNLPEHHTPPMQPVNGGGNFYSSYHQGSFQSPSISVGRGGKSYGSTPRIHQTPPPHPSSGSSNGKPLALPVNNGGSGGRGGGRRGGTPSTPGSFIHLSAASVGSALPSAYNSESDVEPSRFNRSPQMPPYGDPPIRGQQTNAFSPFSGPLGPAVSADLTDALDAHTSQHLQGSKPRRKPKTGIASRASDAGEGHSRPSPDDPPSHPRTATHWNHSDAYDTPLTGPVNNTSLTGIPPLETVEVETDMHRLLQRQKQIIFGKVTEGYRNFATNVPPLLRDPDSQEHPVTPRIDMKVSKRRWDNITQDWRRGLHTWDGKECDMSWVETIALEDLQDPARPSAPVTREDVRAYAANVIRRLDELRDCVGAAFGAREGGEEDAAAAMPQGAAAPTVSPLLSAGAAQVNSGPVAGLDLLAAAQHALRRKCRDGKASAKTPLTATPTPEPSPAAVPLTIPVTLATPPPSNRRAHTTLSINTLDGAPAPQRSESPPVDDLSDNDDGLHATVTSPAKYRGIAASNANAGSNSSGPKFVSLIAVVMNPDTQQPISCVGHALPCEASRSLTAEEVWAQLTQWYDTSKLSFHMAHRNTNDDRPAAVATPLRAPTVAVPGGSPSRRFALRRSFPSIDEMLPPPCPLHAGEYCWVHTLDKPQNITLFLNELPIGLPCVFMPPDARRHPADDVWRNTTPVMLDEFDLVQEITFLQRNNLTPDGIGTLLDHSAALPTAGMPAVFEPSPSPQQGGGASGSCNRGGMHARLDLTTPVESSPTALRGAAGRA